MINDIKQIINNYVENEGDPASAGSFIYSYINNLDLQTKLSLTIQSIKEILYEILKKENDYITFKYIHKSLLLEVLEDLKCTIINTNTYQYNNNLYQIDFTVTQISIKKLC